MHLIDFEQLKIENQTYNEKIEERNEVSIKFFFRWKSKKTSTLRVKITLLAEPKIPTEFYLMD